MFKLISTYLFTILWSWTIAQSVDTFKLAGTVLSANTGEPIPNAYIKYTRTNSVVSDTIGNFIIERLSKGQHVLSFTAFGYDNKDTTVTLTDTNHKLVWAIRTDKCVRFSKETALSDLRKGKAFLLLQGGIAPVAYRKDNDFIKKYKVGLYDLGCDASERWDCIISYNNAVFDYLDNKYQRKWRNEVRKDVLGLKE